jgi:carboxymethylenebutenolidase
MNMRSQLFLCVMSAAMAAALVPPGAPGGTDVTVTTVSYKSGEDTVSAYLARPPGEGPFPALVVIHEWWGLDDWIKKNAREFAGRGFAALAVDLYRGAVTTDPGRASELSRSLPQDRALRDMLAAVKYLRTQPFVSGGRIGSIGWCMGGGYSLMLGLNADTAATVIAYGRVVTDPGELKKLRSPVLGIFGEEDPNITPESALAFEKALNKAGVENQIHIYKGVPHAFMNPNNRMGYNARTADEAWDRIYTFLDDTLKP